MEIKNNLDVKEYEGNPVSRSAASTDAGYSNASTYSSLGYEIDPRTGTLQVTFSPPVFFGALGGSITPSIAYAPQSIASGNPLLGLPLGWSYPFSYIAASQVFINGQSAYYIDDSYDSGLRYYSLKNLKFTGDSGTFPYDDSLQYRNTLRFASGETQYFDVYGRLIGIEDRWRNHAIFYYTRDGDVHSSKLSSIVGFAGQIITFTYTVEGIKVAYPQGGENDITFTYLVDRYGYLAGYINPVGQKFAISNQGGLARNDLISKITYPNGLTVAYEYTTVRYYAGSDRSQFYRLDCVSATKQTYIDGFGQSQTRVVVYSYDPNGDAHNYTGYPTYGMGQYEDALLHSNDDHYRYVTQVDDGVLVTEHQYNRLHLELATKVFTKDTPPRLIKQVTNTFISETKGRYFPPYHELKLIPNYQTPIEVVTDIYNEAGEISSSKMESEFDDYGSPIEIRSYGSAVGNETYRLLDKVRIVYDNAHYGHVIRQDSHDYTDAAIVRRIVSSLTADNKNIATNVEGFVGSVNGEDIFSPEKKIAYRYDASGRIIHEKVEWDDGGVHALESTEMSTHYALDGPVLTITRTNAQEIPTITEVDTVTGWVISQTNALHHGYRYTYDNIGRKLTSTDPLGVVTEWVFEDAVNKAVTQYANGYETYVYNNGFGELIESADNGGNDKAERTLAAKGYNDKAQLIWTEGILGANSRIAYTYDSSNRLTTATDALGNVNRYEYDAVAQAKTEFFNDIKVSALIRDDNLLKEITYSSLRPSDEVLAASLSNSYSKIIKSVIGDRSSGKEWLSASFQYDVNNQLGCHSTTGKDGILRRQDISRDLFGNAIWTNVHVSAPEAIESFTQGDTFFYDNLNRLTIDTNTLGQAHTYVYNEIGLVSRYTDYAGTVFACSYYANNQLASVQWTDGGAQCKKQYTYDPLTYKVRQIEEFHRGASQGRISYRYGLNGAIESITYPDGKTVLYEYDRATGLLSQFTDAIGKVTQYTYDSYGRLTRQQIVGSDYSVVTCYYGKDESAASSGKIKSIQLSNGILSSFTYDGFGSIAQAFVTDISNRGANGVLLKTQYSYDPTTRNLVTLQSSSSAFPQDVNLNYSANYFFNSLNQLTAERKQILGGGVVSTMYQYDAAGNVVQEDRTAGATTHSTSYTYDQDNKLLRIDSPAGARKFAYDTNGNLIDDGWGNTFHYNAQNRMIAYRNNKSNWVVEYDYYPDGLRSGKKINGGEAIRFYYDYSKYPSVINEMQGGKTSHYLALGSKRYVRLLNDAGTTVPEYFVASFRDVVGVVNDSCELSESYAYDPYGREEDSRRLDVDITVNPFRYTTEYTDIESSLIYLRARYYHPGIKRFMSRDTAQLLNRYNYADGNPIMGSDPGGDMSTGWVIGAAIAGIAVSLITGGLGALVLGTGTGASIAVGAAAGVTGTVASNGIASLGHHASGEAGLSGKDWGVSLLAGAASGAAGAAVGGAVGGRVRRAAKNAGWSSRKVTAVGVLSESVSGGLIRSVVSAGVTAGFDDEASSSAHFGERIGMGPAVGIDTGVMASDAPYETTAEDIRVATDTSTAITILEFNPRKTGPWQGNNPSAMTGGNDAAIVHGQPRFSFAEDISGGDRSTSADMTARATGNAISGGTIRLISCHAGRQIGVNNMAQTIANALDRPAEASTASRIAKVIHGTVTPITFQPNA